MDSERLMEMVKEAFPDGCASADDLRDWLSNHTWEVLKNCYGSVADLLCDITDDTYDCIVYDLIIACEYGDGLAYQVALDELGLTEE